MAVEVKISYDSGSTTLTVDPDPAKVGGEDDHHRITWINTTDYTATVTFSSPGDWYAIFGGTYPSGGLIELGNKDSGRARQSDIFTVKTEQEGRKATTITYAVALTDDGETIASATCHLKSRD